MVIRHGSAALSRIGRPWKSEIGDWIQQNNMKCEMCVACAVFSDFFKVEQVGTRQTDWMCSVKLEETSLHFWSGNVCLQDQCLWLFCPDGCGAEGAGAAWLHWLHALKTSLKNRNFRELEVFRIKLLWFSAYFDFLWAWALNFATV